MSRKKPFPLRKAGIKGYRIDRVPDIDQFIPMAAAYADKCVAANKIRKTDGCWDKLYHAEMDRLTSEAGFRVL